MGKMMEKLLKQKLVSSFRTDSKQGGGADIATKEMNAARDFVSADTFSWEGSPVENDGGYLGNIGTSKSYRRYEFIAERELEYVPKPALALLVLLNMFLTVVLVGVLDSAKEIDAAVIFVLILLPLNIIYYLQLWEKAMVSNPKKKSNRSKLKSTDSKVSEPSLSCGALDDAGDFENKVYLQKAKRLGFGTGAFDISDHISI